MKNVIMTLLLILITGTMISAEVGKDDAEFFKFWKEFKAASGIENAKKQKNLSHITKHINFPLVYKKINFGSVIEEQKITEAAFTKDFNEKSFKVFPDFYHADFEKINLSDTQSATSYGTTRGFALLKDGRYHLYIHQSGMNSPDGVNYIKGYIFDKVNGVYKLVEVVNEEN